MNTNFFNRVAINKVIIKFLKEEVTFLEEFLVKGL